MVNMNGQLPEFTAWRMVYWQLGHSTESDSWSPLWAFSFDTAPFIRNRFFLLVTSEETLRKSSVCTHANGTVVIFHLTAGFNFEGEISCKRREFAFMERGEWMFSAVNFAIPWKKDGRSQWGPLSQANSHNKMTRLRGIIIIYLFWIKKKTEYYFIDFDFLLLCPTGLMASRTFCCLSIYAKH